MKLVGVAVVWPVRGRACSGLDGRCPGFKTAGGSASSAAAFDDHRFEAVEVQDVGARCYQLAPVALAILFPGWGASEGLAERQSHRLEDTGRSTARARCTGGFP